MLIKVGFIMMKKAFAILFSTLMLIPLVGCAPKRTTIAKQKVIEEMKQAKELENNAKHDEHSDVIVRTFGSNAEKNANYNALDNKIKNYLKSIDDINQYRIKITSGTYSNDNSYHLKGNGSKPTSYVNYRYVTIMLIKK